jgi:cell division protein FtsB
MSKESKQLTEPQNLLRDVVSRENRFSKGRVVMASLIVLIAAIFAFTFFYVTNLKEQLIQKKNEIHSLSIRVDSLEKDTSDKFEDLARRLATLQSSEQKIEDRIEKNFNWGRLEARYEKELRLASLINLRRLITLVVSARFSSSASGDLAAQLEKDFERISDGDIELSELKAFVQSDLSRFQKEHREKYIAMMSDIDALGKKLDELERETVVLNDQAFDSKMPRAGWFDSLAEKFKGLANSLLTVKRVDTGAISQEIDGIQKTMDSKIAQLFEMVRLSVLVADLQLFRGTTQDLRTFVTEQFDVNNIMAKDVMFRIQQVDQSSVFVLSPFEASLKKIDQLIAASINP